MWNKECVTCARIKPPDVMALSANFLLCSFLLCPLCQCHRCRQPDHMYGLGLSPSLLPWASGAGNTSDTVFLFFIKHFCISCVLPDPSHDQSPLLGFGELTLVSDSTMGFPNELKHHSCLMFPQLPGESDSCFFSCLFRGRDCLWLWNQAIGSEWDLFPCLKRCFTHSCEAKLGTVNWTQWRKLHLLTCVGNWHNSFEAHDQGIIALPPDWEASVPCHSCLSFAWELKMAVSPSKYALVTGLITQDLLSTLNTLPWELKKTFFFFFSRGAGQVFSKLVCQLSMKGLELWCPSVEVFPGPDVPLSSQYSGLRWKRKGNWGWLSQFPCSQDFLILWSHFIHNLQEVLHPGWNKIKWKVTWVLASDSSSFPLHLSFQLQLLLLNQPKIQTVLILLP